MIATHPPLRIENYENDLAERSVYYYIVLTPVFWALGVLIPLGILLVLWLTLRAPIKAWATDGLFLAWALVAAAQGVSVIFNCADTGSVLGCVARRLPSSVVIGWLVLGMALFVGRHYRLVTPRTIRAVAVLGAWLFAFGIVSLFLYFVVGMPRLIVASPLASLVPSDLPAVQFHLTMTFFASEPFLGREWPRLTLFYPWPVALSFTGIAIVLISLQERALLWRLLGVLGGILAIATSLSRAGYVIFFACLGILFWLKLERGLRWLFAIAGLGLVVLAIAAEPGLLNITDVLYDRFTSARAGSSSARHLVYEASYDAFLERPITGHGWPGPYLHPKIPIPLGSHSTFYGVLYTGGLITIVPLFLAAIVTVGRLFLRAQDRGSHARVAFLIVFSLTVIAYGEGVYSFIIPVLPAFLWVGGTIAEEKRAQLPFFSTTPP